MDTQRSSQVPDPFVRARVVWLWLGLLVTPLGAAKGAPTATPPAECELCGLPIAPPIPQNGPVVISKLRQFCGACHGLGSQRFLYPDDSLTWQTLFEDLAPVSREIWASRVLKVLDWPGGLPPPADQLMDPARNRDWMPKGVKRPQLAADHIEDVSTRTEIMGVLQEGLNGNNGPICATLP